jgi:hypothetical protein
MLPSGVESANDLAWLARSSGMRTLIGVMAVVVFFGEVTMEGFRQV